MHKYFAKLVYPTYRGDWYKRKGYSGSSDQEIFADFLAKQKIVGAIYYEEFKLLKLTRRFIISNGSKIDSVEIKPNKALSKNKPGNGLYILCFYGKGEYYESRFRDMALFAKNTGAAIIAFNPKGFHVSTGKTQILSDIVDDGIAVVDYLLARNIDFSQIVFYGNSLGALVQELVSRYFRMVKSINFRQINSNSFNRLSAVFASNAGVFFLKKIVFSLMKYARWEADYDEDYYKTGIYRCYLWREGDKIIKPVAAFYSKVNILQDLIDAPEEYKENLKWLNENSKLIPASFSKKDPHFLNISNLRLEIKDDKGDYLTVWHFINNYLEASNKFIFIK